jgi:arylsulfatase A-like enzyme
MVLNIKTLPKTGLVLLFLLQGTVFGQENVPSERMNVLFLAIDDLNTWLLDDPNRYTGKVVAPNIRRLADSGVLFKRAYTASPYCSPSRTAFLSGVSPWKSGIYDNGMGTDKSPALNKATAFPALFKQSGYYTASYGKISHGWNPAKGTWDDWIPHKRDPNPPGAPLTPVGAGEQDWGPTHLAEEDMRDTMYADAAIAQLQKKHDKPFFVACGLFHPHMAWYVPQKYFDMYPLDEVRTPELLEGDLDDVPPIARSLTAGKSKFVDKVIGQGLHKEAIRAYLATTTYADAQMGRVLDALEKSEYRDNTIVVLLSDHGFHLGDKNHWQKATLWEEATHCLLMIRVPGKTRTGGVSQRFVSLQDIYPTLTELCNLEKPDYVDGQSLMPLLENPDAQWQSTAITSLGSQYGERYVSIRNENFRYTRYGENEEEFYDSIRDPHEWTNQIGNPEYSGAIRHMRTLVPSLQEMSPAMPSRKGRAR